MPPLPRITGREVARALGKLGWVVMVQKGSHAQLKRPDGTGRVTVPGARPVPRHCANMQVFFCLNE